MKFKEIIGDITVFPGEYLLYEPDQQIVLCGAFNREKDFIRALSRAGTLEDKIEKFKKIELSSQERKKSSVSRCKGCGRK